MKQWMLTILLLSLAVSTVNAHFAVGKGTEAEPYEVATLEQLQAIADSANLDKYFILVNDIDASETGNWHQGEGFEPIGNRNNPFKGTFDGGGHTISNLTIDRPEQTYVGLFGYVNDGKITSVNLESVSVKGNNKVGGLIGVLYHHGGEVHASHVLQSRISGNRTIGGLIGSNYRSLYNSSFNGVISGDSNTGGLAGSNYGMINESYASVEIANQEGGIGGLVGTNNTGEVVQSFAEGKISGSSRVGGLVGWNLAGDITNSYSIVDVSGQSEVGGLVGKNQRTITASDPPIITHARITSSYATGNVSGDEITGGLVGKNIGFIRSSYWNTETTGQSEGIGGGEDHDALGRVTEEMIDTNPYIYMRKLDFDQIWQLTKDYPALAWQEPADAVAQPKVPLIVYGPPAHDFKGRGINTTLSETREITIENVGNTVLDADLFVTGPDAAVFDIVGNASSIEIDPDSSEVIEIAFSPDRVDSFQAVLQIRHEAPNEASPVEVQLRGEGLDLNFAGGSGVEAAPYQVATTEQLDEVRRVPDAWFVQIADIDAGETKDWDDGKGFEPIRGRDGGFSGMYDGDGHTISNLTIDRAGESRIGLFGFVDGGVLENIVLENVTITGESSVGSLIGYNSEGDVHDAHITGHISGRNLVGGMIGNNRGGMVYQSSAGVEVHGKHVENTYSGNNIGGLVGVNYGDIRYSYATGDLTGINRVGGLVGMNGSFYSGGNVIMSYATGNASGDHRVGGLIGRHFSGQIRDSYAIGTASGESEIGGLIGNASGSVYNAYAIGTVSGRSLVGGLIGNLALILTPVKDSYWNTETTGRNRGVGSEVSHDAVGLTTAEMTRQDNFVEWDFEEVWAIMEGESYPWLKKIGEPVLVTTEEARADIPKEFLLHQNHPNPFNPVTTIEYALPEQVEVQLQIYDVLGRHVATLVEETQQPGTYHAVWDASQTASGVYIYRLEAGDFVQSRTMLLIK